MGDRIGRMPSLNTEDSNLGNLRIVKIRINIKF